VDKGSGRPAAGEECPSSSECSALDESEVGLAAQLLLELLEKGVTALGRMPAPATDEHPTLRRTLHLITNSCAWSGFKRALMRGQLVSMLLPILGAPGLPQLHLPAMQSITDLTADEHFVEWMAPDEPTRVVPPLLALLAEPTEQPAICEQAWPRPLP